MTQLEIYKKALRIMEKAGVSSDKLGFDFWAFETLHFWALCPLIRDNAPEDSRVPSRFKKDSEIVLDKELDEDRFWFTNMNEDEPKARKERVEHLKELIKLYEN